MAHCPRSLRQWRWHLRESHCMVHGIKCHDARPLKTVMDEEFDPFSKTLCEGWLIELAELYPQVIVAPHR
eukprot:5328535-Amphidinium_carterae.1